MPTPEDLLERIRLRLDESFVGIGEVVADLAPADLVDLLNHLKLQEAASVLSMLPFARAIEVCDQPTLRRRPAIFEKLDPGRAAQILEGLSADERADIVGGMGEHERRRLLPKLSAEMREEVERLLRYPDHTAGGIMTTEFVRLDPAMTVRDALKHIRSVAREKESIFSCYVMEPETGQLLGALSLRDLVMAELAQSVSEVMRRKVISVGTLDDQELVAQKLAKYNLLAVPVVEESGRMVGFVTVDDVIDVLIEEGTEDVLKMAAVNPDAGGRSYFEFPVAAMVRSRVGWLLLLFVAGSLTSAVLRHYEGQLATAVALSFFIPLLIGTGGNAGSQAVMTVIRSLALGEIGVRHAWRVVLREASGGGDARDPDRGGGPGGRALLGRRAHPGRDRGPRHVRHLRLVHDRGVAHPHRGPAGGGGPGRALGAPHLDPGGRHRPRDLFRDREDGAAAVAVSRREGLGSCGAPLRLRARRRVTRIPSVARDMEARAYLRCAPHRPRALTPPDRVRSDALPNAKGPAPRARLRRPHVCRYRRIGPAHGPLPLPKRPCARWLAGPADAGQGFGGLPAHGARAVVHGVEQARHRGQADPHQALGRRLAQAVVAQRADEGGHRLLGLTSPAAPARPRRAPDRLVLVARWPEAGPGARGGCRCRWRPGPAPRASAPSRRRCAGP